MRRLLLLTAILLAAAPPAFAQVTVDLHALDALPNRPAPPGAMPHGATPMSRPQAAVPHAPVRTGTAISAPAPIATAAPAPPATTAPARPPPPTATLPAAPPAVATIAPVPPSAPAATAPQPPAAATATTATAPTATANATTATAPTATATTPTATAATTATPVPAGLQLTFASGESDLSPASTDAIRQFVQSKATGADASFNVRAYAAGVANDPSAPRRLSLARAIAVRTAMIADGVPSAGIYLLALGAQGGDGPPDRVDIEVLGANAPAGAKP